MSHPAARGIKALAQRVLLADRTGEQNFTISAIHNEMWHALSNHAMIRPGVPMEVSQGINIAAPESRQQFMHHPGSEKSVAEASPCFAPVGLHEE